MLEFERELFGGGGVPDEDNVSLGLSPKLVDTYSVALAEKQGKDEYAAQGYLDPDVKVELLSQWYTEPVMQTLIEGGIAEELEQTRKHREETANSRRDQRQMPASEAEALEIAKKDAVAARRFVLIAAGRNGEGRSSVGVKSKRRATIGGPVPASSIEKRHQRRRSL